MRKPLLTEKQLVKGCKSHKSASQKEVFCRYAPLLRSICYRYASDDLEGEDILQESFVKIFSKIESFTWQGDGSFVKWMKRIVVNKAIDTYNKNKKEVQTVDIESVEEPSDPDLIETESSFADVLNNELSEENLIQSLNKVSESYRVVFNLYVLEGYRHKEIAEILNIDEQTSRSRLKRAKKQLQKILKEACMQKMKSVI